MTRAHVVDAHQHGVRAYRRLIRHHTRRVRTLICLALAGLVALVVTVVYGVITGDTGLLFWVAWTASGGMTLVAGWRGRRHIRWLTEHGVNL